MDSWDKAYETVLERLERIGFDTGLDKTMTKGRTVHYETDPPVRTDDGEPAVLYLQTPTRRGRSRRPR